MYWSSRESRPRRKKSAAALTAEGSYRQIAPPKPSLVKEPDISDMMPEWLKERKKAEEENLKAFRKQDNNTINAENISIAIQVQVIARRLLLTEIHSRILHQRILSINRFLICLTSYGSQTIRSLSGKSCLDPSSRLKHKLIGQLFDTYWLIEYNDHLYIIDQHAAHEKVLYEKTVKSLKDRDYNSQMVEPPIILTLNPNEELLLNKYMEYFTQHRL